MGCPDKPRAADARPACRAMASDKQLGFLRKLLGEKDLTNIDAPTDPAALSVREASALIDALMAAPRKQVTEAAVELESGIYRTADDRIYKVYTNQARSRMLAKLLVLEPGQEPRWEYAGTAYRFVQADQRMTLEQAKQFGAIYGVCCNCGATLTDEGSIEAGIGPVCAKKGNWA
ncbi:MAG TPA: DUF6011 domain-containing protein [Nocardioidaceae bacterium]|nr:DUF6011 domain-containing protein [Nocardioidaceae bacterium]